MTEDRGPDSLDAHVRRLLRDLSLAGYHTRDSRGSARGYPDWTIAGPGGVIWRELKTQRGAVTPEQQAWLDTLADAGGDAGVWRPTDLISGRVARELAAVAGLGRRWDVARPNWEWIRIDVLLPDHPKTDGMSDKAFRTLIELWCWCGLNRTDGFVRESKWKTFGTEKARAQLLRVPDGCKHGWAEPVDGGYMMHDFVGPDGHQRSLAEILELSAKRAEAGRKGGSKRGSKRLSTCLSTCLANAQALARKVKDRPGAWQRDSGNGSSWP
jgi:hypothetical protein